jgi:signal transduction histidine kinase
MKKFVPQSLFARLIGALLAVMAITLVAIVVLIMRERRDLALWGSGAWNSATTIAAASEKLASLDPEERRAELERYRTQPRRMQDFPRPRPPAQRKEIAEIERTFARRVQRQLGAGYTVSIAPSQRRTRDFVRVMDVEAAESRLGEGQQPGANLPLESPRTVLPPGFAPGVPGGPQRFVLTRFFDVTVRLPDGDRVVFRTPAPQPGPPLPRRIFLELGVLTAVLAFVLFFMTRTITRPLSDLARAADAVGRGETLPPLKESGARELRDATRAFNAMQDRLQRYLDSRTRVLAAMSHDLRTPLTRLRLRAESIEDAALRERFASDVEEMTQMVNGALNLFKGLTDTESYAPVVIDDLLAALQKEYAELGQSIAIEGHSNGSLQAKPMALKRCLSNLLHNAVKYGERAHVKISDGPQLIVTIRDEGEGIPAAALEQVFEPFYRLESSRSRDAGGGTGLGLSIARDIAQAHGGSIVLMNVPGGGLEATLTLPRGVAHQA